MKKLILILLTLSFQIQASTFTWGSYGLVLHGEKSTVIKLGKYIATFYKVDSLERMINRIKEESKHLTIPNDLFEDTDSDEESRFKSYRFLWTELLDQNGLSLLDSQELESKLLKQSEERVIFKDFKSISLRARKDKLEIMLKHLNDIYNVPMGRELFEKIRECGHTLFVYDDKSSLSGGGYTGANPSTYDIFIPGKGSNAEIRFRFDQPDIGAHEVKTVNGNSIPFLVLDNIFHELVHAKHVMCGTMSKESAEAQAIIEENGFRQNRPETADWPARDSKKYEDGKQVWFGLY